METITTYSIVRLKPLHGVQIERLRLPDREFPDCPWDWDEVAKMVDLENYRYFWFETIQMTRTHEDNMLTFVSKVVARSGNYFINAYIEEYDDVVVHNQALANQMANLGLTHIVRSVAVDDYWTEMFDPKNDKLVEI